MILSSYQSYFVEHLLEWFALHRRDLPWRKSKNPYYIWISEVMLQQTQVNTVIPYFHRFIERFPTIEALADAEEEEVLKHWEGLGYYSRARNLHSAVKEVKASYGSKVPDDPQDIAKLKGVGPYTAGAILSIAFNLPEPAVDGNVMRVLSRFFHIADDITKNSTRQHMEQLIRHMIPHDRAGDFNEALMELGALVCSPKTPQCEICPVMDHCAARLQDIVLSLPVKKKAKPPRIERRIVALVEGTGPYEGSILVRQRPQEGLLARMWELPHMEIEDIEVFKEQCQEDGKEKHVDSIEIDGIHMTQLQPLMNIDHIFSHIRWEMQVYLCKLSDDVELDMTDGSIYVEGTGECVSEVKNGDGPEHENGDFSNNFGSYRWISLSERDKLPFPNVFLKIMEHYEHDNTLFLKKS